jgi:hypothetical protein
MCAKLFTSHRISSKHTHAHLLFHSMPHEDLSAHRLFDSSTMQLSIQYTYLFTVFLVSILQLSHAVGTGWQTSPTSTEQTVPATTSNDIITQLQLLSRLSHLPLLRPSLLHLHLFRHNLPHWVSILSFVTHA